MRTTIDLDDALLRRLRREAHESGTSFRALLHRVILRGLDEVAPDAEPPYDVPVHSLGRLREGVDLVKALDVAAALEDEKTDRELARRR